MRAGWMEVALVALVGLAAHGQNTVALGDLRADDLLVTPAGAAAVAGQAAGLMLTNAVQAGYLCTVAAAHAIVAQAPTKAEMNAAVGGVAAQVVPLPGRISALEAGTNKWNAAHGWGDHSIRGYITAAALEPYATKVKLAGDLADKVTTQALNAVVAPLVSTQKLAQALSELTVEERDPKAQALYHYGSTEIVPSPTNWFEFTAVDGGYSVSGFDYQAGRENVVVPYEFNGQPVVEINTVDFNSKSYTNLVTGAKYIGDYTFMSAAWLVSFKALHCKYIGQEALYGCTSLINVDLPECEYVGYSAFMLDESLKVIALPKCKTLMGGCFGNCTSLELIELGSDNITNMGSESFYATPTNLVVLVTNPQATGYGDTIGTPPRRVVRPTLHTDKLVLGGVEYTEIGGGGGAVEWQSVTNTAASVTIAAAGGPIYWVGSGDPTLTLTGLVPGVPIYLVCQGMSSLQIAGSYMVGGGMFQAGRANHYLIWQYGGEFLVTGITTTEEGQP